MATFAAGLFRNAQAHSAGLEGVNQLSYTPVTEGGFPWGFVSSPEGEVIIFFLSSPQHREKKQILKHHVETPPPYDLRLVNLHLNTNPGSWGWEKRYEIAANGSDFLKRVQPPGFRRET